MILQLHREKKLAAKAQGRQGRSSDEGESDGVEEGSEQGSGDDQDPFFQHEDNPFSDPFFKVAVLLHAHCEHSAPINAKRSFS